MPELIGQDTQLALMRDFFRTGHFPSGILISGPRGSGKKTFAKLIAGGLVCENKKFHESCDCAACRKTEAGNHPDVHWIGLDEDAYSIKIEEIRRLIDSANLKPYEAPGKVFILVGSERMPEAASNAFLKTLEEPPQSTHFILLAANAFNLLETLLSRCIRIKMAALPYEKLRDVLETAHGMSAPEAARFARYSQGCLGRALELKDLDLDEARLFFEKELLAGPVAALERWIGKKRSELLKSLDLFALFLRDMMLWRETGEKGFLYEQNLETGFESSCRRFGTEELLVMLDLVDETREAIEANANLKIALFRMGMKLNEVKQSEAKK